MKKKLISMLAVCSVACCIAGGVQSVQAKAEDYSSALSMVKGAYVRVDTSSAFHNGIKFEATMDKGVYDTLESDKVDYGMVIVPLDYGEITKDNLFGAERKYYIEGVTEDTGNLKELGGGYVSTLKTYEKDTTKMVLEGSIVNIAPSQLTREFVGVPFIRIDNEYYVGAYGGEEYARSMVYVAQKGIQMGKVTPEQETYLTKNYLNYKDDMVDVASKQYTYTVEHIALDPEGNVVETLETVDGAKTPLGTEVTATQKTYDNYTYDAEKSTASDIIYANNRTTLKLYYVQDHVKIAVAENTAGCTISTENGENYVLLEDGTFNFTVTPPADYNKHTQQIYGFVNGALWIANGVEGKYTVDLSSYTNGETIKLGCSLDKFNPTVSAGTSAYADWVSVTKEFDETNSVVYTYSNKTSGTDGDANTKQNWGESGLFFGEVWWLGSPNQEYKFYNKGYKYIRFDVKFADNVTAYNVRVENATAQMTFGADYKTGSGIVKVVNAANGITKKIYQDTWYTFYVQPTKGKMWAMWPDGGSTDAPAVTYIRNVQYLEELPKYDENLIMRTKDSGNLPERDASLEYKVDGDFAGSYKYTNNTGGKTNSVWGEAGIFFNEVYNANLGYREEQGQTFFTDGYQYVKFDFWAEESVQSISLQNSYTAGNNYQHLEVGKQLPTGTIFAIYDKDGYQVDKWDYNGWYTMVIKPDKGQVLRIQTNSATKEATTSVMYVRNISYEKVRPSMGIYSPEAQATVAMERSGNFAGAYKYTNASLGTAGGSTVGTNGFASIYFCETLDPVNGAVTDFHDAGYQYIALDFYAEASVYSISFCENWGTDATNSFTITAGQTLPENGIFAIYNSKGEKVDTWTAGEWYTLVIKPTKTNPNDTNDDWKYPLRIQTNAEKAGDDTPAPVMYLKNVTYCVTPMQTKQN